jgi:hypothetical protein
MYDSSTSFKNFRMSLSDTREYLYDFKERLYSLHGFIISLQCPRMTFTALE